MQFQRQKGLVIAADYKMATIESLKLTAADNSNNSCTAITEQYENGKEVIARVKELTEIAIKKAISFPICPVRVLILDF